MPIPQPKKNESKNEYIARGMSSEVMKKEFPNKKQRLAVLYNMLREHGKEKYYAGAIASILGRVVGSVGTSVAGRAAASVASQAASNVAKQAITRGIGRVIASGANKLASSISETLSTPTAQPAPDIYVEGSTLDEQ